MTITEGVNEFYKTIKRNTSERFALTSVLALSPERDFFVRGTFCGKLIFSRNKSHKLSALTMFQEFNLSQTEHEKHVIQSDKERILGVFWDFDGEYLIEGDKKKIRIWVWEEIKKCFENNDENIKIKPFKRIQSEPSNFFTSLCYVEKNTLAFATKNSTIRTTDFKTNSIIQKHESPHRKTKVTHLSYSGKSNLFLTGDSAGVFCVLDKSLKKLLCIDSNTGVSQCKSVQSMRIIAMDISPDGEFVVLSSRNKTCQVYHIETGLLVKALVFEKVPTVVKFLGDFIILCLQEGAIYQWHKDDTDAKLITHTKTNRIWSIAVDDHITDRNVFSYCENCETGAKIKSLSIEHRNNKVNIVDFE